MLRIVRVISVRSRNVFGRCRFSRESEGFVQEIQQIQQKGFRQSGQKGRCTAARVQAADARPGRLHAGLLCPEPGYAFRASAGPARTQARPAAPAGGPQAGQPGAIRQQFRDSAGARHGDDRPDPATGQGQPLPRPICCGIVRHATHDHHSPPSRVTVCPGPVGTSLAARC